MSQPLFFTLAWTFVALGLIGVFLPVLPTTPFLILAAGCFARSSPRFEAWLLRHPVLGPPLKAWRERGAIPRHAKWIACLSMVISYGIVLLLPAWLWVKIACLLLFICAAIFMLTRPDA